MFFVVCRNEIMWYFYINSNTNLNPKPNIYSLKAVI